MRLVLDSVFFLFGLCVFEEFDKLTLKLYWRREFSRLTASILKVKRMLYFPHQI